MGRSILLLVMILLQACAARERRFEFARVCMGVKTRVVLYSAGADQAERAAAAAFATIARLEAIMSDYRGDSEVSRLAALAGVRPLTVSPELLEVLRIAAHVSELSDGSFDVSVGPATKLWRTARREARLPRPEQLAEAIGVINWRDIAIRNTEPVGGEVMLLLPGMQIDLGGIGKGYAAQYAVDQLRAAGHSRCLVALAGDIAAGDPPPGAHGWRVEIRGERSEGGDPEGVLSLRNGAVSTAGDAEQYIEIEGTRYSHIVDPRTGLGSLRHVTVTVVAPRGEIADAIDTACCLVDLEGAQRLIDAYDGTAAVMIEPGGKVHTIDPRGILRWDKAPATW